MATMELEMMEKVSGGATWNDDATREEILANARRTAAEWVARHDKLANALELLPRYFFVPGKTTKEEITAIVREAYGV